jgi:hypothetical protein
MTTPSFFSSQQHDTSFFDEGPKVAVIVPSGSFSNTSSIDTSEIDGYRQGVELTHQKHFDAGTVKIWAGEPGHILRRNRYGMDKNFRNDPRFEELDYFKPVDFLKAQDLDSPLNFNIITFPIITSDNDQIENYTFDGIIEPFTIRARASFFSIDVPFEAHEVKASMMNGNTDSTWSSDQILTVHRYDLKEQIGFLDQYADAVPFPNEEDNESLSVLAHTVAVVGFFRHDKPPLSPFEDTRFVRNTQQKSVYDSDLSTALSLMTGSTDNYVSNAIRKRSAICGWDYDTNVEVGTDSLAFGGQVY